MEFFIEFLTVYKAYKKCYTLYMENYFIVHGSFSNSRANWFDWLAKTLEAQNKQVFAPDFPTGVEHQNFQNWSGVLQAYLNAGVLGKDSVIIGHSIAPVFISKFLVEHKLKVKRLIFVCGFNNYFGISRDFDRVNESMYFDSLQKVKNCAEEIICFYSDNDPYVSFEAEKSFARAVASKSIIIKGAMHINAESGYTSFEDILKYI